MNLSLTISRNRNTSSYAMSDAGIVAWEVLTNALRGRVVAVNVRSFYVETSAGILCVGVQAIGRGPLNLLLSGNHQRLPFKVNYGDMVLLTGHRVCIDNHLLLDARSANINSCPELWTQRDLSTAESACLVLAGMAELPDEGFSWVVKSRYRSADDAGVSHQHRFSTVCFIDKPLSVQASLRGGSLAALQSLDRFLNDGLSGVESSRNGLTVRGLLGAGGGLTPAGDDLLSGVMLALHRMHRTDLATLMWSRIQPLITSSTHVISAAHLEQAAQGRCSESMDHVLEQIFVSGIPSVPSLRNEVNSIGSTSGWDTIAGVVMVIDAHSATVNKRSLLYA